MLRQVPNQVEQEDSRIAIPNPLSDRSSINPPFRTNHFGPQKLRIPLHVAKNEISASLNTNLSEKPIKLLIDSGAQVSLVAWRSVKPDVEVFKQERIKLSGLGNEQLMTTVGRVTTQIFVGDHTLTHNFQIISSKDLGIPFDGILGMDFLSSLKCSLLIAESAMEVGKVEPEKVPPTEPNPIPEQSQVLTTENLSASRAELVLSIFSSTEDFPNQMKDICHGFPDVFHLEGDDLTLIENVEHEIDLIPGAAPIFVKQYRIPEGDKPELNRQLDELEAEGVIVPSDSPWNFPLLLIPKKADSQGNKQSRLVVDFKRLNDVTIPQQFPIPLIEDILDTMGHSKVFTTLDVRSAYHQINVRPSDTDYLAFQTNYRRMKYVRMPFGLANAPRTWQRVINTILKDVLGKNVSVYLDDIIIHTETIEHNVTLIQAVLERLRGRNVKLKPDKCLFFRSEVIYLGHILCAEGLRANPAKTEAIDKFPTPISVTTVQRFLGAANYYRRYVPNYSSIARPLHRLCCKDVPFEWTEACQKAFEELKHRLITAPVLIHPDFGLQFIVTVDASNHGLGAILSQITEPDGVDRPIQYISRSLNKAESNYSTIEKELLSIVWAVSAFHHYLFSSSMEFLVVSDHRPLMFLMNLKNTSSRLYRWKLTLMEYQFRVVHRKGTLNKVADALSRVNSPDARVLLCTMEEPRTLVELLALHREKKRLISHKITPQRILTVLTRSKTSKAHEDQIDEDIRQLELTSPNVNSEPERPSSIPKHIFEENGLSTQEEVGQHIFTILHSTKCSLKTKIERKIGELTVPENLGPYEPHDVNDFHTVFILPSIILSAEQMSSAARLADIILKASSKKLTERITVNLDVMDPRSYFNLKQLFSEKFRGQEIEVTFYLCRKIEIKTVEDIQEVLQQYHRSLLGGHAGLARTQNRINRFYWWPGMNKDIKDYIRACAVCEKSKIHRHTKAPMQVTSVASRPFEKIFIDLVGPINPPSNSGNHYIFTCNCDLTKFGIAVPIPDATAITTARTFLNEIILKFNLPDEVVSDNGTNYTSEIFTQLNKLLNTKHIKTSPYNPKANQVERFHRSLGQYMRAYVQEEPENWDFFLPYATYSYNTTPHSVTGYAPHELIYGFLNPLPSRLTKREAPMYNYDSFLYEFRFRLRHAHESARKHLLERKSKNKKYYDRKTKDHSFNVNDLVNIRKQSKDHKFDNPYDGPWRIVELTSPVSVKVKKGNKFKRAHVDQIVPARAQYDQVPDEVPVDDV